MFVFSGEWRGAGPSVMVGICMCVHVLCVYLSVC